MFTNITTPHTTSFVRPLCKVLDDIYVHEQEYDSRYLPLLHQNGNIKDRSHLCAQCELIVAADL